MSVRRYRVDVYLDELLCEECGEPMRCVGNHPTSIPIYIHQCANHHTKKIDGISYPRKIYDRKEEVDLT